MRPIICLLRNVWEEERSSILHRWSERKLLLVVSKVIKEHNYHRNIMISVEIKKLTKAPKLKIIPAVIMIARHTHFTLHWRVGVKKYTYSAYVSLCNRRILTGIVMQMQIYFILHYVFYFTFYLHTYFCQVYQFGHDNLTYSLYTECFTREVLVNNWFRLCVNRVKYDND